MAGFELRTRNFPHSLRFVAPVSLWKQAEPLVACADRSPSEEHGETVLTVSVRGVCAFVGDYHLEFGGRCEGQPHRVVVFHTGVSQGSKGDLLFVISFV